MSRPGNIGESLRSFLSRLQYLDPKLNSSKYIFIVPIIISALNLIYLAYNGPVVLPDTADYIKYAEEITRFNFMSPDAIRTPVYPAFISLSWIIFGKSYLSIALLQVLLTFFSQVVFIKILRSIDSKFYISIAVLLFGFSPLTYLSLCLITESLTIFLILGFVYSLISFNADKKYYRLVTALSTAFLLAFTRPQYFFVIIAVGVFMIVKKNTIHGIILILFMSVSALCWSAINYSANNYFGLTSTIGFNLINHTGGFIEGARDLNPELVDIYLRERGKTEEANSGRQEFTIAGCKKILEQKLNLDYTGLSKELTKISGYLILHYPFKYLQSVLNAASNALNYYSAGSYFKIFIIKIPTYFGIIFYLAGIIFMFFVNFEPKFLSGVMKVIFFSNFFMAIAFDIGENFRYMMPVLFIPFVFFTFGMPALVKIRNKKTE